MNKQEKLEALYEVFESEDITEATLLSDLQWDSMVIMSVMVLAMKNGKKVSAAQLRELSTVEQILEII